MTIQRIPAALVLEDGSVFHGRAYGATGETFGEAVFTTAMTGYQETLTDPSYAEQIVVQTSPHIGVTGVNDEDPESDRIWAAGYVVRAASRIVSNWRATESLTERLTREGIVGITGVDTRAVTRRLRDRGSMRAGIFSGDALRTETEMVAAVLGSPEMAGRNLSAAVSAETRRTFDAIGERLGRVAVLDLGIKTATIRYLRERGFDLVVMPQSTTFADIEAESVDAVFYSNGPGDPAASDAHVEMLQEVLRAGIPFFGICFGNQLLGRALGFETYKLPFGHRGINQPVMDVATGKVEITSQNHGFAVRAPIGEEVESPAGFGRVRVSHYSLNDEVVEGLEALDIPAFSVQFHPESAAGPHDSMHLFDRLGAAISARKAS